MTPDSGFSARLTRRREQWWGRPFRWRRPHSHADALHRAREHFALRSPADPDHVWHCCAQWPRTLVNKWNARAFAQRHDCRIPLLLWHGRRIAAVPWSSLPARYVIRPVWGTAAAGVYVVAGAHELLRDAPATPADIRRRLFRDHGPVAATPLLVEAFVPAEDGSARMPIEYKCHTFGGTVAAVQVLERSGQHAAVHRYYTAQWEPFADPMDEYYPLAATRDPPPFLDAMLAAAGRLGESIGTYMRVDFFGSTEGPVFNEFSSTPQAGRMAYTRHCDALFGALWQRQFADAT